MSKYYLWSVDTDGYVNSLSSWNNSWHKIDCTISKIKKFKVVAAASWCIWSIGADNELYLYIPNSDYIIRSPEIVIENQRKSSGIFSAKYLKTPDPSEFTAPNYYGKLIKTDLNSFQLPSSRWKWENDWSIRIHFNGQLTNEGWTYSPSFLRKFQVERYFITSNVRRRFWQRYRYFHAFDRWLYIAQETQPFEISCSQDCCIGVDADELLVDYDNTHIIDVGCGGEMLPHQKDGFLSVWAVNSSGQILSRLNVHRQNPEGSHWCIVKLPTHVKAVSLAVGPLGNLLVCTCFGEIYFRENITWKNPLGTSWKSVALPNEIWDKEQIVQLSMSIYSIWARSTLGRVWYRSNVNLHEDRTKLALGDCWHLISNDIQFISASASGQLFAIHNNQTILYKSVKSKSASGKQGWIAKLPSDIVNSENGTISSKLSVVSASALFLEDDVLPSNWLQSPLIAHKIYQRQFDINFDWRMKILASLENRDKIEYKNPKFSNYTSSFEQTFWSKASECEVQCFSGKDRKIWFPGSVVLHHKIKNNVANATIHIDTKRSDIFNLTTMLLFIESHEVICLSKYNLGSEMGLAANFGSCLTIVIFVRNKIYNPSKNQYINISRMLLKFPSETDVEDWIMAINFVSFTQNDYLKKSYVGKVWFINQFFEPFSATMKLPYDTFNSWQQDGGHFSIVESGAKGCITWAIGFNGTAWAHTKGWGGTYLGSICSSKDYLYPVTDMRTIIIIEYQKLKFLPGEMSGKFIHHMWTDEFGNVIRNKESVQLQSRRWFWFEEWSMILSDDIEFCDSEGWAYSTGINQIYDGYLTWNKTIRRRKWSRSYKSFVIGPWKEIRNNTIQIIDISIFPGIDYAEEKNHLVLAVTNKNKLLLRKGVTINCPEGHLWLQLKSELKFLSVTINNMGTVWVVAISGCIWKLKFTNFKDVIKINPNDWEKVSHPDSDGRFRMVSSGDNESLWAVDINNHLWMRKFDSDLLKESIGTSWIYICDGVSKVSCASYFLVWVVFMNGCLAERVGITKQLPQGTNWNIKLNGVATYVSVRGA